MTTGFDAGSSEPIVRMLFEKAAVHPAVVENGGYWLRPPHVQPGETPGHWNAPQRPVDAWIPIESDQPMRLRTTGAGELGVRRIGVTHAPAQLKRGAVVLANSGAAYDAMMVTGERGIHDLLLPKQSGVELGYEIELPERWTLHSGSVGVEPLVEARDGSGVARLRLRVREGIGASGEQIGVQARIARNRITLQSEFTEPAAIHAEWEGTGLPSCERDWPVMTPLSSGKVLVTGRAPGLGDGGGALLPGDLYDPISSTFTMTAPAEGFFGTAVVQAPSSGLVVAFGNTFEARITYKSNLTIYNPTTDEGITVKTPAEFYPDDAVVLSNGKIFVCGKDQSNRLGNSPTAWIFDPDTKMITAVEASRAHRIAGKPVLLPSGQVAIFGTGSHYASYDPSTGTITGDAIDIAAENVPLSDGRILVFGGESGAAIVDASTGKTEAVQMPDSRSNSVGVRLASGKVLVVNPGDNQLSPAYYLFDATNKSFSQAERLPGQERLYRPALAPLLSGGVLMLSRKPPGGDGVTAQASPQVYIPAWNTHTIRSLNAPRTGHTATLLSPGKVLIAGGDGIGSAEIYDSVRGVSRIVSNLLHPRQGHTANLLPNGKVLLFGGNDDVAEAELFNSFDNSLTTTGKSTLSPIYVGHQATTLSSGKVLITGGTKLHPTDTKLSTRAELYDPQAGVFQELPPMKHARVGHVAALLDNGDVLLEGGVQGPGAAQAQAEVFDSKQNRFIAIGSARDESHAATAVRLRSGKVIIAPRDDSGSVELFDPEQAAFSSAGQPIKAYSSKHLVALASGQAVLFGSFGGLGEESEVYDESTNMFSVAKGAPVAALESAAISQGTGTLLLIGGQDRGTPSTRMLVHDFAIGQTLMGESSLLACPSATVTALADGRLLRLGDKDLSTNTDCYPSLITIEEKVDEQRLPFPLLGEDNWKRALILASGKLLVIGAQVAGKPDDNALVIDSITTKTDSFRLRHGFAGRVPTMMSDGRVLLTGGVDYDNKPNLVGEIFDPAGNSPDALRDFSTSQYHSGDPTVLLGTGDVLLAGAPVDANSLQTLEVFERSSMKFVDTGIRGVQKWSKVATRLASGDAMVMGDGGSFIFHASTRTLEFGLGLPFNVRAGISAFNGDILAATPTELLRITPASKIIRNASSVGAGAFAPLRQGGIVHVGNAQWMVTSPVPEGARRPQVNSAPTELVSGSSVSVIGKGFSSCTAFNCSLGPGSALGPPTALFLPLDGGGPLVSPVLNWSDATLTWRVPSSAYHGMGWLYVIVDGVPSEGFAARLLATAPGGGCTNDAACASGVCIAGMCCDRPCGACESCWVRDQAPGGKDGVCKPIAAAQDPHNDCDEQPAESCGHTGACDGKGVCQLHPDGTACKNDGQCNAGVCLFCSADARLVVSGDATTDCSPFRCEHGTCATQCSSDASCLPGYVCDPSKHECGPYCSEDETRAISGNTTTECHPFRCRFGVCPAECESNLECAPHHTCSLEHRCVLYVPFPAFDQSCSIGFARVNAPWQALSALTLCLWGRRRARGKKHNSAKSKAGCAQVGGGSAHDELQ